MAQRRTEQRAGWPVGLYEPRPGYYTYRSPISGKAVCIGRVEIKDAIAVCLRLNATAQGVKDADKVGRLRHAHVESDEKGLLSAAHITQSAMNYEHLTGVYFLILNDEIVYVGRSVNILGRLATHHTNQTIEFNRVFVERCRADQVAHLEAMYINKFKPKHNTSMPAVSASAMAWDGSLSAIFGAALHTRHS